MAEKKTIKFKGIEFEEVYNVDFHAHYGMKGLKYWDGYEWHYFLPKKTKGKVVKG